MAETIAGALVYVLAGKSAPYAGATPNASSPTAPSKTFFITRFSGSPQILEGGPDLGLQVSSPNDRQPGTAIACRRGTRRHQKATSGPENCGDHAKSPPGAR